MGRELLPTVFAREIMPAVSKACHCFEGLLVTAVVFSERVSLATVDAASLVASRGTAPCETHARTVAAAAEGHVHLWQN